MMAIIFILSIIWMTVDPTVSNHQFGTMVNAVSTTTNKRQHYNYYSNIANLPIQLSPQQQRIDSIRSPSISKIISTIVKKRQSFQLNVWNHIKKQLLHQGRRPRNDSLPNGKWMQLPRGGAKSTTTTKVSNDKKVPPSKMKKKKKTITNDPHLTQPSKGVINEILKDEDSAAKSLGDAIRQNAHLLLNHIDDDNYDDNNTTTATLESLGHAMGSSDYTTSVLSQHKNSQREGDTDDLQNNSGNRRRTKSQMAQELTSPTAVIAHYFLNSHGGMHILQCICSILATLAGMGGILLSQSRSLQYTLIQRTLFFGMCKHIAGVIMAIYLVARKISRPGGFTEATQSMQSLIRDPISQYVFYTACVLFWLPSPTAKPMTAKISSPPSQVDSSSVASTAATASVASRVWWQQYSWIPLLLVGPVVLREFISIALVISDVLTLIIATTAGTDTSTTTYVERLLKAVQAIVNEIGRAHV